MKSDPSCRAKRNNSIILVERGRMHDPQELIRLIRNAAYSLRALAGRIDGDLSGKVRYDIFQISNPLLSVVAKHNSRYFVDRAARRRLTPVRRHKQVQRASLQGDARRDDKPHAGQQMSAHAPLPAVPLGAIGEAWSAIADKMPSGEWRWAIPAAQMADFTREREAARILTAQRQQDGRTVLLARRVHEQPTVAARHARPLAAARSAST